MERFYELIFDIFDKFVHRTTIRSSSHPIWSNKQLLSLKNKHNKEFDKLSARRKQQIQHKLHTVLDDRNFLEARANYETLRMELHSDFIREKARCVKHDSKSFWRHINNKRKSNQLPAAIELNN